MWSDSYWILDLLGGLQQLGWTRTAWTPTAWLEPELELVSRTDVVGLFLDPELELIYSSRTDVVGLVSDPGPSWRTPTAWLDSDCLDSNSLAGTGTGTGESDRCGRTLLGSGTGTDVLESDRCGRTRIGSGTFLADSNSLAGLGPMFGSDSMWYRIPGLIDSSRTLADSYWTLDLLGGLQQLGWTRTAWLDSDCLAGPGTVKLEIRKVFWEPVESGFP